MEASSSEQSSTFVAEANRVAGCFHIVLITTGSVASVKAPLIVSRLLQVALFPPGFLVTKFMTSPNQWPNVKVQVVSSKNSLHFFDRHKLENENPGVKVWVDQDEWEVCKLVLELHKMLYLKKPIGMD